MLDYVILLASEHGSLGERREQISIGMRLRGTGRPVLQAGLHELGKALHWLLLILGSGFL
jgi:hypothetical protein